MGEFFRFHWLGYFRVIYNLTDKTAASTSAVSPRYRIGLTVPSCVQVKALIGVGVGGIRAHRGDSGNIG